MKTVRIFLLLALPLLILAACNASPTATANPSAPPATAVQAPVVADTAVPAPVVTETSAPAPVVSETTAPAAETLSDAEMEALITEKAKPKHTLEFILSHDKTAEEWSTTIDLMISRGAKINPEEKEMIINWLVNRKK